MTGAQFFMLGWVPAAALVLYFLYRYIKSEIDDHGDLMWKPGDTIAASFFVVFVTFFSWIFVGLVIVFCITYFPTKKFVGLVYQRQTGKKL